MNYRHGFGKASPEPIPVFLLALVLFAVAPAGAGQSSADTIGYHEAKIDAGGRFRPAV